MTLDKHIHIYNWIPDRPKAILLVSHGMAEHAARYHGFATYLNKHGIGVVAPDQRGHGKTAGDIIDIGYTEEGDFWAKAIGDLRAIHIGLRKEYQDTPIILFGHSMGSLLSRDYISKFGKDLKGAIFSGTASDPGLLGKIGLQIAKIISLFQGKNKKSELLKNMSFGKFNDTFKPARTEFDWLSRDEAEVDKYITDPYCGTTFTAGFWVHFLKGVAYINTDSAYNDTPQELPIYMFAGDKDPVGDQGKGVSAAHKKYEQRGIKNLKLKLYTDGRHEMLNESNRAEVYQDILEWIESL